MLGSGGYYKEDAGVEGSRRSKRVQRVAGKVDGCNGQYNGCAGLTVVPGVEEKIGEYEWQYG